MGRGQSHSSKCRKPLLTKNSASLQILHEGDMHTMFEYQIDLEDRRMRTFVGFPNKKAA